MPKKDAPKGTGSARNVERTLAVDADEAERLAAKERPSTAGQPSTALEISDTRRRPVARGEPAPLTQSEVEILASGKASHRIAERLSSRPMERIDRPETAAAAVFAPVKVSVEDLRSLAENGTSAAFRDALERSASMAGRFGQAQPPSESKSFPELSPEGGA